jgi:hypothetical protein
MTVMRQVIGFLVFSFLISVSCFAQRKFKSGDEMKAMEKSGDFILLTNDKMVKTGKIVSSGFFGKKVVKTTEGDSYEWKEIKAFQSERGYYAKVVKNDLGETGIFLPRIIKGNINVYKKEGQGGMVGVDGNNLSSSSFYIQKDNDRLYPLTAGNLKAMVQDYQPALDIIAGLKDKEDNNKKLEDAILAYNAK